MSDVRYISRGQLDVHSTATPGAWISSVPVLAVVADDLERVHPPESPDERYQRVERIHFASAEELERIRPRSCTSCARSVSGDDMRGGRCGDCRRKRGEVDFDTGLLTLAEWSALAEARRLATNNVDVPMTDDEKAYLVSAVDKLSAVGGIEKLRASTSPESLTHAEWTALFGLCERLRATGDSVDVTFFDDKQAAIRAIDKLRTSTQPVTPALTAEDTWRLAESARNAVEMARVDGDAAHAIAFEALRSLLAAGKLGDDRRGGGR